ETRGREILTQAHNYVDIMRGVLATGDRAELRRAHYACCANDVVAVHGFILPEHSRRQVRTGPTPQGPPATHPSCVRRRRAYRNEVSDRPSRTAAEIVSEDDRAV